MGTIVTATATCPVGKALFGGGVQITVSVAGQNQRVSARNSYPSAATTWTASAIVTTALSGSATTTITAYAVCAA